MLIPEMARNGMAVAARHAAIETAAASRIPAHLQEATLRKGSLPPTPGHVFHNLTSIQFNLS